LRSELPDAFQRLGRLFNGLSYDKPLGNSFENRALVDALQTFPNRGLISEREANALPLMYLIGKRTDWENAH
jgi:hypothetical protein